MRRLFLILAVLVLAHGTVRAQSEEFPSLYKVTLVRAAPGHLIDLIDLYKEHQPVYAASGDGAPFWMRHSQGDQWDLMLLFPMGSYGAYYHPDRIELREAQAEAWRAFEERFHEIVAWQSDLFVYGPALPAVEAGFEDAGFFHVEMFEALPGHHEELIEQRRMENAYLRRLHRPENLLFIKSQGASVDVFTLGFYRDIQHFAESADIPLDDEDAAARAAGFESVYTISPYLRSLIREHHDTLAVAIR
ncbi:MAG: hypothetical protein HKN04_12085 [Rhodothermaceae bacterium]|nr:hypothetical protein [Rhodothermaceae bacterium]